MAYQWKEASHIKADANAAGEMCEQLSRTIGLTAKNLLNANREEGTPLHDAFEWDDSVASELYREQQARHIINCICVKVDEQKKEPIRAFFTVEKSVYEPLNVIVQNEDKHAKLLETAKREALTFKQKYETLSELKPLFDAIDLVAG